jgi:hypothetical protein
MRHHVVVAMTGAVPAKVECLSCHKQHRYKGYAPGEKPAKPSTKKAAGGPSTPRRTAKSANGESLGPMVNPLDALLASRAGAPTRNYSPAERYAVGELLTHPSFGVGAVTSTPSPGKMAVLFRDSTRLLLHERQVAGTPGAPTKLQPPPRREDGPRGGVSDAPPKTKPIL